MSLRRRSDLKSLGGRKVFIDLGSINLHEEDDRTKVRVIVPEDEMGLGPLKRWLSSGIIVVVDLSAYSGDFDIVGRVIREMADAAGAVACATGTDSWVLTPKGVVLEVQKKV